MQKSPHISGAELPCGHDPLPRKPGATACILRPCCQLPWASPGCGRVDGGPRPKGLAPPSGRAAPSPGTYPLRSVADLPKPPPESRCRAGLALRTPLRPLHVRQRPLGCDSVAPRYQALQVHPGPWLGHAGGVAGFPVQRPAGVPHWAEVRWATVEGSARACLRGTRMRSLGRPRLEGHSHRILGEVKGAVGCWGSLCLQQEQKGHSGVPGWT